MPRWDNLTDNRKPIYLFLFSSPIFTAFPHCLKKLWWDPSGGFGAGKPRSAVWEAVPITESDSGRSPSMHTSSKRTRGSQSIHDLRGLMSPQAYIRDLVSPHKSIYLIPEISFSISCRLKRLEVKLSIAVLKVLPFHSCKTLGVHSLPDSK